MLVGDIGGTKVRLAQVEGKEVVKEEKFWAKEFKSFDEVLQRFLQEPVKEACLAVAGPVKEGRCQMTNLNWVLEEKALEKRHNIASVHLMNDLEAAGYGLKVLKAEDVAVLNRGEHTSGHKAVVSAGTGLGMVGLFWDGKEHHPMASEGGHVDFAPQTEDEWRWWKCLQKEFGHVSVERALSGQGLHKL
jgi:glucokinase